MGGTFSKSSRPVLAGSYFDFLIQPPSVVLPSVGRTVALLFTHDWGPLNEPRDVLTFQEWMALYDGDPANPTNGYIAARQAFKGEATPDFGGAGAMVAVRLGGSAAAKAQRVLVNTAGSPANALRLEGKYEGTRGNDLRVTTQDHAADSTQAELILLDGATVLETYIYDDADIADLAAQINANSDWVMATMLVDGTALAAVSGAAFTGGNDGLTLTGTDYTDALETLEVHRFGVLVAENLTDSAILASIKTWTQEQNATGRRFFLVAGGALDENIATANARSLTLNDPDILNVGVGSIRDLDQLDVNGDPVVLSMAQMAPRVAGILANRGDRYSLTFAKIAGVELVNGPSVSAIRQAYDGGTIVFDRGSDREGTVRIAKGLTTFTTKTDTARPRAIFSQPKFVATMHEIQEELVTWANENVIGKTTVDNDTRQAVLAQINSFMRTAEEQGSVQPGWSAYVDPSPPPSDDDPFVAFVIAAKFGRSTEQVFFVATLG